MISDLHKKMVGTFEIDLGIKHNFSRKQIR